MKTSLMTEDSYEAQIVKKSINIGHNEAPEHPEQEATLL